MRHFTIRTIFKIGVPLLFACARQPVVLFIIPANNATKQLDQTTSGRLNNAVAPQLSQDDQKEVQGPPEDQNTQRFHAAPARHQLQVRIPQPNKK
jgi:hypothetical protein